MSSNFNISSIADSWYFAYGSNLHIDPTDPRAALIHSATPACAKGLRLTFNRVAGTSEVFANLVFEPSSQVWGVAYKCDPDAMARLDRAMGMIAPRSRPISIQLESRAGPMLHVRTYVAGKKFITKPWRPEAGYLNVILEGAQRRKLPRQYLIQIKEAAQEGDTVLKQPRPVAYESRSTFALDAGL
jgi:hypothetical protein